MKQFLFLLITLSALWANYSRDSVTGTVTDNATGLQWQDDAVGMMVTWQQAIDYCEALALGGQDDWRLPNINELHSIVDRSHYNPAIDPAFEQTTSGDYYWSSTSSAADHYKAWSVMFYDGTGSIPSYKNGNKYARCVRGGQ